MNLAIVTCTWKRDINLLIRCLSTWINQSRPPYEIIVSDINPDPAISAEVRELCDKHPLVTHIHTPMNTFSVSRSINIGIRHTSPNCAYIACTGSEMIFSHNYFEEVGRCITLEMLTQMPCGWLPQNVVVPPDPHQDWGRLIASIVPGSNIQISGGTFLCASRDWWFRIHGYDEGIAFMWPDSDLARRAILSGFVLKGLKWEVAQALHQWHPRFGTAAPGRTIEELRADMTITRNLQGWGER